MARSERGISQTPFLITFLVLFLGASGVGYMMSSSLTKAEETIAQKNGELLKQEEAFKAKVLEYGALVDVVGFTSAPAGEEGSGAASLDPTSIKTALESVNRELTPPLAPRDITCQKLIDELRRQIGVYKNLNAEQKLIIENKESAVEEEKNTRRRVESLKNEEITRLTEEHRKSQTRLEQNIQQYERQVTDLRERIKNLSSTNEKTATDARAKEQELNSKIKEYEARVIALSKSEQLMATPMPDGKVTRADIDQGYAYIDLGSKDGIRNGQRFKVYTVLKGGLRQEKGEVRTIRVEKDFSQCTILAMPDDTNPIVMGDYVWNKFFVKGRKLNFAFLGKFGGEHVHYTTEQLQKLVQEAGHIASDSVHADTDYVVIGEEHTNDPQYRLAQDYRIEKIKPLDLFEFFGFGSYK
jgi:hypothetical protein